jgi:hypothetical protein
MGVDFLHEEEFVWRVQNLELSDQRERLGGFVEGCDERLFDGLQHCDNARGMDTEGLVLNHTIG